MPYDYINLEKAVSTNEGQVLCHRSYQSFQYADLHHESLRGARKYSQTQLSREPFLTQFKKYWLTVLIEYILQEEANEEC